jgi:hypothetical protein
MRLVQMVPALPPARDGIGDYAVLLARGLAVAGIDTTFLTYEPGAEPGVVADRFESRALSSRSAGELSERLEERAAGEGARVVLLHYDPIRVAPRQVPGWLVSGLRRWKGAGSRRRLVATFHELTPDYRERKLDLVLRPLQRHVTTRLLDLTDLAFCSVQGVASRLAEYRPGIPIRRVPVYSNLLEPLLAPDAAPRDPHRWIALGSTWRLINSLETFVAALRGVPAWCAPRHLAVVGGGGVGEDRLERTLRDLPSSLAVSRHPGVSPGEASGLLLASAFCFQRILRGDHPFDPHLLFKSGVFAAATVHGAVTVLPDRPIPAPWGPELPRFVALGSEAHRFPEVTELPAMAQTLNRWYHANAASPLAVRAYLEALLALEAGP